MSPSEVSVTLTCENPAAELILVNSKFEPVAQGLSPLSASVVPGIYSLKSRIGESVSERLESLAPSDEEYLFHLTEPEFESPMPLDGTTTSREYHRDSVYRLLSEAPRYALHGGNSALMVFVRDTSYRSFDLNDNQRERYARNFRGLSLLDMKGEEIFNFDSHPTFDAESRYIGTRIELEEGPYVLAWNDGGERTCFAVNPIAGWTLQIYIRLQPVSKSSLEMRPDFSDAAFAYDRLDTNFIADREDYRIMEAARQALLEQRNLKRGQLIRELLQGKFENPMLGVYACHLIMIGDQDYPERLGEFIANTASLVGSTYPDLLPLAWRYETVTGERPAGFGEQSWSEMLPAIKGPPLLTLSWDLLLECADACEVPIDSLPAFRPAGNLVVSGAILTWEERFGEMSREVAPDPEEASGEDVPPDATTDRHRGDSQMDTGGGDAVASMPRRAPLLGRIKTKAWNFVNSLLTRMPDGSHAPLPSLEIKNMNIDSPEAAAEAVRLLAKKAPWQDITRYMYREGARETGELGSVTALQRDLMVTLARAADDPEILEAIGSDYISNLIRAHRVRIESVENALRGLDLIAVSAAVIRRVRAALSSKRVESAIEK